MSLKIPARFSGAVCSSQSSGLLGISYILRDEPRIVELGYNRGVKPALKKALRFIAATAIVAVVVVLYTRVVKLNPTTVALTFLLVVLIVSANWGLTVAVFMSFVAALAFNFFFL